MTDIPASKELEAKCFCGSVHFKVQVPVSALPISCYFCHCSVCRYMTSSPCSFHGNLPLDVRPSFIAPSTEDNLSSYTVEGCGFSSKFCSTCGCHVAGVGLDDGGWTIATSIVTDHGPENFNYGLHVFDKSAKDGGIAKMLTHLGERAVGNYNPPDDDPSSKPVESKAEVGVDGEQRLRAECRCGGVSFTLKRPTQEVRDDDAMARYVSPLDKTKWMALLDVCGDCRLINGTQVIGWTFVPLSICEPKIGSDLLIGTAKTYASSPGVLRSFCGTCGATVFYTHQSRIYGENRQIVDIATGILRAPEGSMAENWLTWRTRLAWVDDGKAYDCDFVEGVEKGMKKWALGHYGQELNMEIG